LGPLEVEGDRGTIVVAGHQQRALLAVLLLEAGRVIATDRLIDLLWGDAPPRTAATSLQNVLSKLRREFGSDMLATHAPGYVLRVAPEWIDANRFEQQLREARRSAGDDKRAQLQRALELGRAITS
jgi:DNA-binding SARP family transcriptional activator